MIKNTKSVIVFGCGIAGLAAAHYLAQRGYKVTVIESASVPGGSARSSKNSKNLMPTEYSWRGFGPWYHNTFSVMKEIPTDFSSSYSKKNSQTVYNSSLTKQINFNLLDSDVETVKTVKTVKDIATVAWYFGQGITSDERSRDVYSTINCSEMLTRSIDSKLARTISWTFGPWIGSDASRVSYHQVVKFFQRNLWPGVPSPWYNLPHWISKGNSSWAFMNRPINEGWFDPWVAYLANHYGVSFHFNSALQQLDYDPKNRVVTGVMVESVKFIKDLKTMTADNYVLCMNPFTTKNILKKNTMLIAADKQLQMFEPLTNKFIGNGPHVQIGFQIGFDEKINMPIDGAYILIDSEYDITLCVQDQLWDTNVFLGQGVKSLWSGTACLSNCAGKLFGKMLPDLTYYEFVQEIKYQISKSIQLNKIVQQYNGGRELNTFLMIDFNVWKEWWGQERQTPLQQLLDRFAASATFINDQDYRCHALKWVNGTNTEQYRPTSQTSISNLWLGGAHTKTSADLWSMEGAVESGRRVADLISGQETVLTQHPPVVLRVMQKIDNQLYRRGFPQFLQFLLLLLMIFGFLLICLFSSSRKIIFPSLQSKSRTFYHCNRICSQETQHAYILS